MRGGVEEWFWKLKMEKNPKTGLFAATWPFAPRLSAQLDFRVQVFALWHEVLAPWRGSMNTSVRCSAPVSCRGASAITWFSNYNFLRLFLEL